MFEKEAEEYCMHQSLLEDVRDNICKAFEDGAEFGYNKANEWHYVKDGDLPKEDKVCLLYLGRSFNPTTGWISNGIWHFEDGRKNSVWQIKVIAWKEIVPPKEIK